jgi:hypothetical protein
MVLILRRLKQVLINVTAVAIEACRKRCQIYEAELQTSLAMLQVKIKSLLIENIVHRYRKT